MSTKEQDKKFAYTMLAPAIFTLLALSVFPICFIIFYSFTDFYYLANDLNFIGFKNYVEIFNDRYFTQAILNTFKFMILAVFFEVFLALVLAGVVNSLKVFAGIVRNIIVLPYLMPPVTTALIWQIMFSNNEGIINKFLNLFGFAPHNWLQDPMTALYAILIIDIWQYMSFVFLLLYTAMLNIPKDQFEAAKIDGANIFQQFIYITIPNIIPTIAIAITLRVIDTFRLFDKVNILTGGGPANSTATISQYIFEYGIKSLKIGYSSAVALIMVCAVLIFSIRYIQKQLKI